MLDSLVVHLEQTDDGCCCSSCCATGWCSTTRSSAAIADALRDELSPRHVPDEIVAVPAIPRTLTGKKLEVPVKRILGGAAVADVASRDALVDPAAIEPFVAYARERATRA